MDGKPFTRCLTPDCDQLPRFCSVSCASETEGSYRARLEASEENARVLAKGIAEARASLATAERERDEARAELVGEIEDNRAAQRENGRLREALEKIAALAKGQTCHCEHNGAGWFTCNRCRILGSKDGEGRWEWLDRARAFLASRTGVAKP